MAALRFAAASALLHFPTSQATHVVGSHACTQLEAFPAPQLMQASAVVEPVAGLYFPVEHW